MIRTNCLLTGLSSETCCWTLSRNLSQSFQQSNPPMKPQWHSVTPPSPRKRQFQGTCHWSQWSLRCCQTRWPQSKPRWPPVKANFKEPVADLNDLADVAKQDGRLDPLLLQLLRGVQVERLHKRFHTMWFSQIFHTLRWLSQLFNISKLNAFTQISHRWLNSSHNCFIYLKDLNGPSWMAAHWDNFQKLQNLSHSFNFHTAWF